MAATLVAVDPALAYYATKLHPLVLDSLGIALVALTMVAMLERPGRRNALLLGLALGAGVLTRPTIAAVAVAALAWTAWRGADVAVWRAWALALVVSALIIAPWVARNYAVLGTFVLTRTNTAFVFWLGNHPDAPGGAVDPTDPTRRSVFETAPDAMQRVREAPDELAKNRVFRDEALRHVRADPAGFVGRLLRKLTYFWWFAPYQGHGYPVWQVFVYKVFHAANLLFAALGLLALATTRRARRPGLVILVLVPLVISLTQSAFYVEGRHRLAVEALLLVFTAAGMLAVARRGKGSAIRDPSAAR